MTKGEGNTIIHSVGKGLISCCAVNASEVKKNLFLLKPLSTFFFLF